MSAKLSPNVVIMDGTAYLFRSYYSTLRQNLTNHENFPTGAIFGVVNAIKKLQKEYPAAIHIVVFDHQGKNFRHELYPNYKANRKPADPELKMQIEPLYEIVRALNVHFICTPDVEADDVIATLATFAQKKTIPLVIASNDKDLHQLISPTTHQLTTEGLLLDEQAVIDKIGILPTQVRDYLALVGDSVDNIKGVPSIGSKTAAKLLSVYTDIEEIKARASEISGKMGEKIRQSFAALDLAYKLASLKDDIDLAPEILHTKANTDTKALRTLYERYGFNTWLRTLDNGEDNNTGSDAPAKTFKIDNYDQIPKHLLLTKTDLQQFIETLKNQKSFVLDLETDTLEYMNAKIVGFAFFVENKSYYLPTAHTYKNAPKQLELRVILKLLTPILENETIGKVGQNIKYDAHVLRNYNIKLKGIAADTMLMSYCLNSTATRHNMDALARHYLNHQTITFAEVTGSGKKQLSFATVPLEVATPYACEDAIVTHLLHQHLENALRHLPDLQTLYQTLELPLIDVLIEMERTGTAIDASTLSKQQQNVNQKIKRVKKNITDTVEIETNLDSPKQLQRLLFTPEGLNLTPRKKTPTGQPSTDEEALVALNHSLANDILEYRMLNKLNSTYLAALPKQINSNTKRLHTTYHQAVTTTGRLSSTNPNLQNIPIRSTLGRRVRAAFVAPSGALILAADYSQIELRIIAHMAGENALIDAFQRGLDIHLKTASNIFKEPLDTVTPEQRYTAKAINFGLLYGMSAFGLSRQIGISMEEAKNYIDNYFLLYPRILDYYQQIKEEAYEKGFVETLFGRRLYLPDIKSPNKTRQKQVLRAAINAPIQGSSADLIKKAMISIYDWQKNRKAVKMIMQVHDELVFEVAEENVEEYSEQIRRLMVGVAALDVPLVVEVGTGKNWEEAH